MKTNEKKKEVTNVDMVVKGIALYPKEEDGLFTMKLLVDDETLEEIENKIVDLDGQLTTSDNEYQDKEYVGFNVKTVFDVPIYDKTGKDMREEEDYPIYYGAKVLVRIRFKTGTYKRKSYVAGYMTGAVVLEQGENQQGCTFDNFKEALENEDIQF